MAKKSKKAAKVAKAGAKRGPKPEILKIDGGWEGAVKKALGRGKPPK